MKRQGYKANRPLAKYLKVIHHYFPNMFQWLKDLQDPRNISYITYTQDILIFQRILAYCCHMPSMNKMNERFNEETYIKNMRIIFGDSISDTIPHGDTINDYLSRIDIEKFKILLKKMVKALIDKKVLDESRIDGTHFQVLIDGTQLFCRDWEHVEKSLKHNHSNGEITYHTSTVAAYIDAGDLLIPLDFEFIENEKENTSKQDCEINATKRLLSRIKQNYPRLPICLNGDALYFAESILELCEKYHWHYLIRYKKGSAPSVFEEYEELKKAKCTHIKKKINKKKIEIYEWVNDINYKEHHINLMELRENDTGRSFCFATDLEITEGNIEERIQTARNRWHIENRGFNEEKNHGFSLTHAFSYNRNAIKGHFLLMLVSHLIMQLLAKYKKGTLIEKSASVLSLDLLEALRNTILNASDIVEVMTKFQVRTNSNYP